MIHVWPYESFEDREKIGAEARKTGKWPPKTQEFIITQENKIVQPAPFSPPLPERKLGEVYEFRTYTYQPGAMPTVLERSAKSSRRAPKSHRWCSPGTPSSVRSINIFMCGPTRTRGERERLRAEATKTVEGWPPPTREFLVAQENMIMTPAPCAPFK